MNCFLRLSLFNIEIFHNNFSNNHHHHFIVENRTRNVDRDSDWFCNPLLHMAEMELFILEAK